jgi:negative regulator of replication initiation
MTDINQLNDLNNKNRKHAVVITEKLYRYIVSQGRYGEEFTQVLERVLQDKTQAEIRKLAGEEY